MKEHPFYPQKVAGGIWGRQVSIVLAGLLATAALLWQTRKEQLSSFRAQFENDASARTALLMREADESLLTVKSLGWFFSATRSVDGRGFQAFAAACLPERKELQGSHGTLASQALNAPTLNREPGRRGRASSASWSGLPTAT